MASPTAPARKTPRQTHTMPRSAGSTLIVSDWEATGGDPDPPSSVCASEEARARDLLWSAPTPTTIAPTTAGAIQSALTNEPPFLGRGRYMRPKEEVKLMDRSVRRAVA